MKHLTAGFLAGFIATLVLSAIMVAKMMMGVMPALNVIKMLAVLMTAPLIMGWIAHFAIGTVAWGGIFAGVNDEIPGHGEIAKGLVFATIAWLAMMIFVMPLAGAGFFGLDLGIAAPVMTLILHWVYGAVLGAVYAALTRGEATA